MSQEQREQIAAVIKVLNNIDVRGRQNLLNLYGAIEVLEDILSASATTTEATNPTPENQAA